MNTISKEVAKTILKPHLNDIRKCIESGWDDYMNKYSEQHHLHEIRTRACIIRDHIVDHIRQKFSDKQGVKFFESNNLFLIGIDECIYIRFKKLDDFMRTSNYPTQQALFFNQQQLPLPGMPPDPIYLNAGYIPDIFWSQINGIYIACPQGDDVSWFIDLSPEETLQEPSEFRFPTTAEPEISKVRVRKTEQEMEEIADESKR